MHADLCIDFLKTLLVYFGTFIFIWDNYYTSHILILFLIENSIKFVGTMRKDRPTWFFSIIYKFIDQSILYTFFKDCINNIYYFIWKDKGASFTNLVSNFFNFNSFIYVRRKFKDGQKNSIYL